MRCARADAAVAQESKVAVLGNEVGAAFPHQIRSFVIWHLSWAKITLLYRNSSSAITGR